MNGKKAKIFFKNGFTIEGIIINWTPAESHLRANNGDSIILYDTKENVMMVHIQEPPEKKPIELSNQKLENTNPIAKATSLADLKMQAAAAEREIVKQKLLKSQHVPSGVPSVKYEQPSFSKSSLMQRSSEKNSRDPRTNIEKLRKLYTK